MNLTRMSLATASTVLALAALAGCGGGGDDTATDDASAGTRQQGGAPAAGARMPGATGEIAAISGRTLQVQNDQTGQVAVTWTARTAVTQQVDAALGDVHVGACVAVVSDGDVADGEPVAAASVRIAEATDDGCQAGLGGGPGGGPVGGPGGERPEGMPSDRPSDLPTRTGGGAFGEVTAVSADGFTVSTTMPGEDDTTSVDVTVSGDTTYTTNAAADAAALKVGRCVNATGDPDDTGAVSAERIEVSDAVDGECTGGFVIRNEGDR